MKRTTAIVALACATVLATGLALAQQHQHQTHGHHAGHQASAAETRLLVMFPPDLVEHTLSNMRDHLLALQEINEALASGEHSKAAKVAEDRLGMSSLQLHGAHEVSKHMPQGMQDAGTAMHRAASRSRSKRRMLASQAI